MGGREGSAAADAAAGDREERVADSKRETARRMNGWAVREKERAVMSAQPVQGMEGEEGGGVGGEREGASERGED